MACPFPPVKRVVTGHTAEGKAIIWKEEDVITHEIVTKEGAQARFHHPWSTDQTVYDLNDENDLALKEDNAKLIGKNGQVVRYVDMPPHHMSPLHRTVSLDYGILVFGEVILHLEDGVQTRMKQGDIAVQRGTIHAWENPTDEWCRMMFVLSSAKPFLVDGKPLGDDGYVKQSSHVAK